MHPELERHIGVLELLGVDGMSSDESDTEEVRNNVNARYEVPHFHVSVPQRRAKHLAFWLSQFDAAHTVERRTTPGGSRGAWPHMRSRNEQNPRVSTSTSFVPDLPENAYDEEWLAGR